MVRSTRWFSGLECFVLSAILGAGAFAAPPKLFPPNRLFATSFSTDEVKMFRSDGTLEHTFGAGALLSGPECAAFGPDGFLYVTCSSANHVVAIDADETITGTFDAGGVLTAPNGIAFGPLGEWAVSSRGNDRVYVVDAADTVTLTLGSGTTLDSPRHLAYSPDGVLHVASYGTNVVFRFGVGGGLLPPLNPAQLVGPIGVAFSPEGRMLVTSSVSDAFAAITKDDTELWHDDAMLETPYGIVVGPDRRVYVAADATSSVLRFVGGDVDTEIGYFDGMSGMGGLAFSPYYFTVKLTGKLLDTDEAGAKRSGKAMLGIAPGSGRVTLSFEDDPNDPNDLATLFGASVVLHGQESGAGKNRVFVGTEIPGVDKHFRMTLANLKVFGDEDNEGFFVVKSVTGSIARIGVDDGGNVYRATLESTKRLN